MARFFNVAGPCDPTNHYTLPPERRLPGIRELIDSELYFVIHAPRQVGKTTCFRTLAQSLTAAGHYVAVHTSCEAGQAFKNDVEQGVAVVVASLQKHGRQQLAGLSADHQVPDVDLNTPVGFRLAELLTRWSVRSPLPVVVFFDEIDALYDDVLISVLRQLRDGYPQRPTHFPQSVALIGLRDVRDYRASVRRDAETLGTSSPFNIKVESLTIRNFNEAEVAELYGQHTAETGQVFTPAALSLAFELTDGQPWLVNALARQLVQKDVTDRTVAIDVDAMNQAREALIARRDTHLDSLIERLREERVRRVIGPILTGDLIAPNVYDDDIAFVKDLGLVKSGAQGLEVANPIYREVIPRALAWTTQDTIPVPRAPFIAPDGRLLFDKLLSDFVKFWRQHGEFLEAHQPYPEAAPQLVLMAYLQRIVNGGGTIDREYAVGSGRIDLCVRWRHKDGLQRFALELKVRTDKKNPLGDGLDQLASYLRRLELTQGTLVIFDRRSHAPPIEERGEFQHEVHDDLNILILWL